MSRAALKRAKKRAKTAAAAAPSSTSSAPETKPILDEGDEGGGGEDLLGAVQNFRSEKKKKEKKKKSKKDDADFDGGDAASKAPPEAASSSNRKEATEATTADAAEVDTETEMEPELEALLSTLTPLQILMLDGDKKPPPRERRDEEKKDIQNSIDDAGEDDGDNANDDRDVGEAYLGGIDPLALIGDLTTEHRARVLLSSLLAPSGVTLHEFYERYWGKRPLLACWDREEEDSDGAKKSDKGGKGNKEEEEEARHAMRLDGFLNRTLIDDMIRRNKLRYGLDLNVTRYTDATGSGVKRRMTLDPPPKKRRKTNGEQDDLEYVVANPNDIWSNIDESRCSLRLLRPHEHNDDVHALLSLLESEFGCMVGSNAYFTPKNSQGFAPHYDDVDVFILQLEGYKRWRVYAPFNKRETLPRASSRDYSEREVEEIGEGPLMDVALGPGDVLYLPRGWIHQAETVSRPSRFLPKSKDDHSLHLTVSAMQNWCWADFLEMLMPEALESAASSDRNVSLREGLPRNFLSYMGTMHQLLDGGDNGGGADSSGLPEGLKQAAEAQARAAPEDGDGESLDEEAMMEARSRERTVARQKHFKDEAKKRIMRVCKQAVSMLDDTCDQIGKRFLSDRLPPALLPPERSLTKEGPSNGPSDVQHHHDASKKIWPNTLCRLVRPNIARLVVEDDKAVLYHCLDNSRVFHGTALSPMEFEVDDAPALEQLLTTLEPHWIMVKDLIHGDVEDKMGIAQALFDEGILATLLVEAPDRSVQTG